jgi:hypothetical protein
VPTLLKLVITDGGRSEAGFTGRAGDCVTRAIAIAAGLPYRQVYDELNEMAGEPVARTGVPKWVAAHYLQHRGAAWTPTMFIGSGCRVHLRRGEVPRSGRYIMRVTKHFVAVVDGVMYDTHDPSRNGSRCVYGYWTIPE